MNADGSGQTRLTNNAAARLLSQLLSRWPEDRLPDSRDGNSEIYVMNADGSGQTSLTNNPAADSRPAWSPDGHKIAFDCTRDGNCEIYAMNADGSGQTNLSNNATEDLEPDWQPLPTPVIFVHGFLASKLECPGAGELWPSSAPRTGRCLERRSWRPMG